MKDVAIDTDVLIVGAGRPVIKQVIETTDLMTKMMGTPNKFAQALRDTVIPMVSRVAPFQHAFVERLSELGIAYRGTEIRALAFRSSNEVVRAKTPGRTLR